MEDRIFDPEMLFPFLTRKYFLYFQSGNAFQSLSRKCFSIVDPKMPFPFYPLSHFDPKVFLSISTRKYSSIFDPEMFLSLRMTCRHAISRLAFCTYTSGSDAYC